MRASIALCAFFVLVYPCAASANPPRSVAVREADFAATQADRAGLRLLRLLDQTRLSGDPRLAQCVDAKLNQVNSFARMILARRERVVSAEERGDRLEAEREREVIRTLVLQLRRLEREGRACVDHSVGTSGTIVEVERAPELPREDLLRAEAPRDRRRP